VIVRDVPSLRAAIASALEQAQRHSAQAIVPGSQHSSATHQRALRVGFVPTMGALHEGHRTLVQRSCAENAVTVVSIFVNPTQFNNPDDLAKYPRDEARDVAMLDDAGVQIVFAPTPEVMYPPGFNTWVTVKGVTDVLEGEFRPGHFRGVATVVARLLRAVRCDRAYFGEKDWQQLLVVRQLTRDLLLDVEIVGVPTVREADGLALSSRNARLDSISRTAALAISAAIKHVQESFAGGFTQTDDLEGRLHASLRREPALTVEYAVIVDAETLRPVKRLTSPARVLVAATVGGVRLIDNGPVG
jgi:pantoate--beta-alanine ligase